MRNVVKAAVLAVPLLWVACAGSPEGPMRTGVVPLGPKPETEVKTDDGKRAAEDQTPPVIGMGPDAPAEPGVAVTYRTVTQVVEPPPAPSAPTWSSGTSQPEYQLAGGYQYALVPAYEPRRERETWFPYGTAIGIGIGAAFDHHHGHHGHHHHHGGAWLGGTLGLMFDLARWH